MGVHRGLVDSELGGKFSSRRPGGVGLHEVSERTIIELPGTPHGP